MPPFRAMLSCLALSCVAAGAFAEPLRPAAGDRVARHSAAVASEIQDAIANDGSDAAENLRRFVDTDDSFRIYHRDNQLLVAMSTRRNVPLADRLSGERQAAALARDVIQTKFSHLLESEDGFLGLDANAVRVVFIEPDALDCCPGRRPGNVVRGTEWQAPMPFGSNGLWSNGWATPQPCTGCQ
jgi:hypothetical protein